MKKFLFFAVALLCLVACNQKDNALNGEQPIQPGQQITLSANVNFNQSSNAPVRTVAPNTPISSTDVYFHWEADDKVMITDGTNYSLFTIINDSISEDGKSAKFTGTALASMSNYNVFYAGKDISEEFVAKLINLEPIELTNATNNYNIIVACEEGTESGFTMNAFYNTLRLKLTGDGITLGAVKFFSGNDLENPSTTINFGTDGLALTATAQEVWLPINTTYSDITFRFYDTDGELIMEKSKEWSWTGYQDFNELVTFPELEVKVPTKGKAKRKLAGGGEVDVDWVQLWAGGPKWATYNLGATTATEYGDYFCWGGSYANGEGKAFQDDHNTGDADIQYGTDDTAKKLWGDNWQMPKKTDLDNLLANTTSEWIDNYQSSSKNGYLFTGKGDYSDNSIFLPAAGYYYDGNIYGAGSNGNYWGSTPNGEYAASSLFMMSSICFTDNNNRSNAYSVRAILYEPGPSAPENVNLPDVTKTNGTW